MAPLPTPAIWIGSPRRCLGCGRETAQLVHAARGAEPAAVLGNDGIGAAHREPPAGHDGIERDFRNVEVGGRHRLAGADGSEEAVDDRVGAWE